MSAASLVRSARLRSEGGGHPFVQASIPPLVVGYVINFTFRYPDSFGSRTRRYEPVGTLLQLVVVVIRHSRNVWRAHTS